MHDRLATLGQRGPWAARTLGQRGPWGRPPPRAVAAPRLFRQAGRAEISVQIAARTAGEGARRLAEGDFASQDTGLQLVCLLLGTRLSQEENVPGLHVAWRHRLLLVAGQPVKQAHAHGEGANRRRPVGRGDRSAKRREQQRRAARGQHHRRERHGHFGDAMSRGATTGHRVLSHALRRHLSCASSGALGHRAKHSVYMSPSTSLRL